MLWACTGGGGWLAHILGRTAHINARPRPPDDPAEPPRRAGLDPCKGAVDVSVGPAALTQPACRRPAVGQNQHRAPGQQRHPRRDRQRQGNQAQNDHHRSHTPDRDSQQATSLQLPQSAMRQHHDRAMTGRRSGMQCMINCRRRPDHRDSGQSFPLRFQWHTTFQVKNISKNAICGTLASPQWNDCDAQKLTIALGGCWPILVLRWWVASILQQSCRWTGRRGSRCCHASMGNM